MEKLKMELRERHKCEQKKGEEKEKAAEHKIKKEITGDVGMKE